MENKMFCCQCQETCRNIGCNLAGMCGKNAEIANLMDELVQQLKVMVLAAAAAFSARPEGACGQEGPARRPAPAGLAAGALNKACRPCAGWRRLRRPGR